MYYLITTMYCGPNLDQHRTDGRFAVVQERPGCTNMSHEPKTKGWLGTTNDWSERAHGEFETIEAALAKAAELGYTVTPEDEQHKLDDRMWFDADGNIAGRPVAFRWHADCDIDVFDAADFYHICRAEVIDNYGITATSTDDDIDAAAARCDADCIAEYDGDRRLVIDGTANLLRQWRDELAAEEAAQED